MKVSNPFILCSLDRSDFLTHTICRSPKQSAGAMDHTSRNLSWICCVFRLIMKCVSITGLSGWPSWRFKMTMLGSGGFQSIVQMSYGVYLEIYLHWFWNVQYSGQLNNASQNLTPYNILGFCSLFTTVKILILVFNLCFQSLFFKNIFSGIIDLSLLDHF